MKYSENAEEAAEFLRLLLPHLGKHTVPATPPNYLLWYEYVSGKNPELKAAMDSLIQNKTPYNEEVAHQLHLDYIAGPQERAVMQMQDDVRKLFRELIETVSKMGGDADKFEKSLTGYADQIEKDPDVNELRTLIGGLMEETSFIQESRKGMQEELSKATGELEHLKQQFDQVRAESLTDPLTGLLNRKAFDQKATELIEEHPSEDDHLSLLMLDIDFFKKVNDNYGHLVGDEVLRVVAHKVKESLKGSDVVARFGGEEFAVILPRTQYKGALVVAESICELMRKSQLKKRSTGEPIGKVTLSIGVGRYRPGEAIEDLIDRADSALYKAKQSGRDRVVGEQPL